MPNGGTGTRRRPGGRLRGFGESRSKVTLNTTWHLHRVGCVGKENSNPASDNNPGHAEVVEVIFDPGQTWDILELLSRSTSPTPGQEPVQSEAVRCG